VEEESTRALQHLRDVLMVEGAQTVAAILLESVVGTNGILVPPPGYLEGVRTLCDELGIVLIADEVMSGFGRCGEWFAIDNWRVAPDLICFAKGVNSGYLPLGGVVISRRIAETFKTRQFPGGLTYSGHPLACASAVASINIFEEEGIIDHARHLGRDVIGPELETYAAWASSGRSSSSRTAKRESHWFLSTQSVTQMPRCSNSSEPAKHAICGRSLTSIASTSSHL
jgi:taurine--2-oxoglutarate transaminase